jgi:glycine C-acetyltransferase
MYGKIKEYLQSELQAIEDNGLFKKERIIISPKARNYHIYRREGIEFLQTIIWDFLRILK